MAPFLLRCFFITTVFFGGFVFGIVYVNHLSGSFGTAGEPSSLQLQIPDIHLNETVPDQIEMEDGDHLVIYGEGDEEIKKDLITSADVKRDLAEKQSGSGSGNFFSDVGLGIAGALEAVFKGIYAGFGSS
ncbi:hypothetical protein [Alteribacter natronophilus]|uniref:hypothetical protein n=1 Tax=Alteribacter natronophilus TaxID=2583810 RepID=UPI00110D8252|nr:hypothetical protein [Alteribacter natronophilus]TMW73873.1 hypothetical protein FGB90_06240 [Alteribacter natronophilus]